MNLVQKLWVAIYSGKTLTTRRKSNTNMFIMLQQVEGEENEFDTKMFWWEYISGKTHCDFAAFSIELGHPVLQQRPAQDNSVFQRGLAHVQNALSIDHLKVILRPYSSNKFPANDEAKGRQRFPV